ncbi:MAG: SDR family NAD(P)-dependent oxidoreductase [Minicystis sp.]
MTGRTSSCARGGPRSSEAVAAEIAREGGRARVLTLDVGDAERTVAEIRAIDEELGGLDLVVANAGIGRTMPIEKLTWESIAPMIQVNFTGAIATLTAALPGMLARRRGHLVAVSSLAAITALPSGAAYCATKSGLSTFLESMRIDLEGSGVRVTTVVPGVVETPMSTKAKKLPPFMMPVEAAVDLIVERLAKAPAVIEFPFPMSATMHLIAALPRPLRDAAVRRFPVPEEPDA